MISTPEQENWRTARPTLIRTGWQRNRKGKRLL
jgi:hypothetical protein